MLNKHKVQRVHSTPTDCLIALPTCMYHFHNADPRIYLHKIKKKELY